MGSNIQYAVKISADDAIIQLETIEQVVEQWGDGEDITGEIGLPTNVLAQIPDPVFLEYCLSQMPAWDTNHDDRLSTTEAAAVTQILVNGTDARGRLTSLEGIEYFTGLTNLYCQSNQLTSLDVSKNTALTLLYCSGNQLTSLDVSKNTVLTDLAFGHNQLTSLDVSKNTALTLLDCQSNQLTSLDVSKNTVLTNLSCGANQLTSLDVSKNTVLTFLGCHDSQLTSLDVSKNTALTGLYCIDNQLTSLDVSKNTALTFLRCDGNQLTSLDISTNVKLTLFYCQGNPGDGISKFPIKAWFDANAIPSGEEYDFTTDSWDFNGITITPEYEKAI